MIIYASSFVQRTRIYRLSQKFLKHPLFAGSAIMFLGSNLVNFFAYLYHVVVGRLLGPASYGELAAILSLITLVSATFSFIGTVIIKFVSSSNNAERTALFRWLSKKTLYFAIIVSGVFLIFSPAISTFFHLETVTVAVLAPMLFVYIFGFVYRSFLQGELNFKSLVIANNIDIIGRFIFSVILIWMGLSVFGAVVAAFLSSLLSLYFIWRVLKRYRLNKVVERFRKSKKFLKFSLPVVLISFSIRSLLTADILLAKHFLSPHEAGIYASMSTLGKVIFYASSPISAVMYPLISKRYSRGQGYKKILFLSALITLFVGVCATIVFLLLPDLMIKILYGSEFLDSAQSLYLFGVFVTLFALSSILINFYLSTDKLKISFLVFISALVQILGIWFFHNSIVQMIKVSIFATSLLLGLLLFYYIYDSKRSKN